VQHAVRGGIWVSNKNLLEDRGNARKTLIDFVKTEILVNNIYIKFVPHRKHKNQESPSRMYETAQS
jgi:hypothetical protein